LGFSSCKHQGSALRDQRDLQNLLTQRWMRCSTLPLCEVLTQHSQRTTSPTTTPTYAVSLKIGHHGSATSTIAELLAAVRPKFAVISVGSRNVSDHPRKEVLNRLERAQLLTYRTEVDAVVAFYLDRQNVGAQPTTTH
jgi:beta-lactamase superfamily II metal-dependent hydrolase